MPDVPRARRAAPDPNAASPLWARAVHAFYDPIFDIRSRAAFQVALNDYVTLPADERAFHQTHLLYRMVQGLESLHGLLARIDAKLDPLVGADLSALELLEPIRAALDEIASGAPSLVAVQGWEEEAADDADDGDRAEEDPDPTDDEDPDFIYDTIPDEAPAAPRRPAPAPARPPRPARPADPAREALVGELVPASEGPQDDGAEPR